MLRLKPYLFFPLLFAMLLACQSGDDDPTPNPPVPGPFDGLETYEVTVKFPEGKAPDLSNASLLSWDKLSPISGENVGKVLKFPGEPAFAYLMDKENRLLLVGLVDANNKTLDLHSTAKVLLYWGFGGPYFESAFAERFFAQVETFPIWSEWKTEVERMFAEDPYFVSSPKPGLALAGIIKKVAPDFGNGRIKDDNSKASDLLMDSNFRSGLQVFQTGLSQFQVANTYRRRVKGFLYQTHSTGEDGNKEAVNEFPGLNNSKAADQEVEIPTANGITSFSGTVYDFLLGETEKSFRVESEPINIPLKLQEKSADYDLRAIGMGKSAIHLNQAERSAQVKITLLTFTLDFVVPLIGDALTAKATASKNTGAPKTEQDFWEATIIAVTNYLDKMPDVSKKVQDGNLSEAVLDFFTIGYNQFGSIFLEDIARVAAESIWEAAPGNLAKPSLEDFKQSAIRKAKILTAIDLTIKGTDYARKVHDIANSNTLEIFQIKANEIEINLEPRESSVFPQNEKELTAFVKSTVADGQVIEYEWSTSGKYGYLFDDIHQGNSFSSSKNKVKYFANVKQGSVPQNASDTVKVTTYIKQGNTRTRIGEDHAIMKISDKLVFTTGLTIYVPVIERISPLSPTGKEYTISTGGFESKFSVPNPDDVLNFVFTVIREDGSRGGSVTRTPSQLTREGSSFVYRVGVGSIRIIITYHESEKDEAVKKFTDELEERRNIYSAMEVAVNFK